MASKPKIGTQPANFPGRVNDRRIRALRRIQEQLASGVKLAKRCHAFHNRFLPLGADDLHRLNREADALVLRILPPEQARAVRTKKDRRGRGKLSRAA